MITCHPICTEVASSWKLVGTPILVGNGVFVQRSAMRGARWLRLSYQLSGRWSVTAYKTQGVAIAGEYGNKFKLRFAYGGPNVWCGD
jgi:hypothetical protein